MLLLCPLRINVETYVEATYLAPVLKIKPIIISLLCSNANHRDKLLQSIISYQLFFLEKSPKPKHRDVHLVTVDFR